MPMNQALSGKQYPPSRAHRTRATGDYPRFRSVSVVSSRFFCYIPLFLMLFRRGMSNGLHRQSRQ
jgi:hypothetical protein